MNTRTNRRRRAKTTLPSTPLNERNLRDPAHVKGVVLKMGVEFIAALDELCLVNKRSRRELVEIFTSEAIAEFRKDPTARITPL